jgi:hypothetical protein
VQLISSPSLEVEATILLLKLRLKAIIITMWKRTKLKRTQLLPKISFKW